MMLIVSCTSNPKGGTTSKEPLLSFEDALGGAQNLNNEGQLDSALALVQIALSQDSLNYEAQLLQADIFFAMGNYKGAMGAYTFCLDQQPKNPKLWARLGKIYLDQNDLESALKYFSQAINFSPSYADGYIGRAIVFGKKNEMEQAYLSLQTAIDFDPNNVSALLTMAEWKLADSAQIAIQYFSNAIKVDSTQASFYFKRATAFEKFNSYKAAGLDYQKAYNLAPENFDYTFNLAYFYYRFKVWEQSKFYFLKCLEIKSQEADALYGKALCEIKLGENEDAIASLETLLLLNPNDADIITKLDSLR
ncbi:MAG: tetratricopeptide repeat protein [Bacteroidia bacterium]